MTRPVLTAVVLAVLGAIPLMVVLVIWTGDRSLALDAYVLYLGAVALLVLARVTRGPAAEAGTPPDRRRSETNNSTPSELARIEREVVLATGSEFDQHMRIKPLLQSAVDHRLWTRRGIGLEESPGRAQEALGPEVWELVKPGPPDPNARYLRGLDLVGLRRALDTIESL